MTQSDNNRSDNGNFRFRGRERYYAVAGRQLDEKTNDGTDDYIREKSKSEKTTIASIIAVGIVAVTLTGVSCIALSSAVPVKLPGRKTPVIDDRADLFENDEALEKEAYDFYSVTGIAPQVITVYDEDWKENYVSLDIYTEGQNADSLSGFAIVYSVPKSDAASGKYRISIYHARTTEAILNGTVLNGFRKTIKNDIKQGLGPEQAFTDAFRIATAKADKKINPDKSTRLGMFVLALTPVLVVAAAFITALILTIRKYKRDRKAYG